MSTTLVMNDGDRAIVEIHPVIEGNEKIRKGAPVEYIDQAGGQHRGVVTSRRTLKSGRVRLRVLFNS
jgi:hypothetical protein